MHLLLSRSGLPRQDVSRERQGAAPPGGIVADTDSNETVGLDTVFRDGSLAGFGLVLIHVPVAGWTRRSATVRA